MPGRERRTELDGIDHALVAALRRDGRASNVELAKRVGVSEKTVRSRIARLAAEHGLTVIAELAEPAEPPRPSRMVYLVHAEPGRRFHVAEVLAAHAEVDRVHLATGAADVVVTAAFADDAAALRFQVQTLERHPGIRAAAPCHLIGEVGGPARAGDPAGPRVDTATLAALMIGPQRAGDVPDAMCTAAVTGLGADRALVTTLDPADPLTMTVARRRGLSDRYLDEISRRVHAGELDGVVKRVWERRLHVLVADARTDPLMADAHDLVRDEGYVTLLTLPVLFDDSLLATISLYYDRPTVLDDDYVATAQGVADHFAVALARTLGRAPVLPAPG